MTSPPLSMEESFVVCFSHPVDHVTTLKTVELRELPVVSPLSEDGETLCRKPSSSARVEYYGTVP